MKRLCATIVCALCLHLPGHLTAQVGPGIITTFAGGDPFRDGGPATQATLRSPSGVAVDTKGNVYIADTGNGRIRRVSPDGIITTVAGTGKHGFSGDGGPAVQAQLSFPSGVAVDTAGVVYIADTGNGRIRRVSSDGIITTVAGTGERGFSGDGGAAIQARLNGPWGVAVDVKGNVYIADRYNHSIRRVGPDGMITTFAGTGSWGFSGDGGAAVQAQLSEPRGVSVDTKGNVYIVEFHRIRRVSPDGMITTFTGTERWGFSGDGGSAVQAQFYFPQGVVVDTKGNVYIVDGFNHRIRRVSPDGIITTFAGMGTESFSGDGGPAVQAQLNQPTGVAVDARGNVYIADTDNHRVRRVSPDGIITTFAGTGGSSGDGGPAVQAQLNQPTGVAVDARGNVYIADTDNHRVCRVSPDGTITTFAGTGTEGLSGDGGPAIQARLNRPHSAAVDANGNVYIADYDNHRIRRVSPDGIIITFAGTGTGPFTGGFSGDGGPAVKAQLSYPGGVAVDAKGNVYIADQGSNRIRRIGPDGIITTIAGRGITDAFSGDGGPAAQADLDNPVGVAMDAKGSLYIAGRDNHRVRRIGPDGIITTIAGTGTFWSGGGFSGDGGPAAQAALRSPTGVAVDANGNVYIADSGNHRIRRVSPDGIITTFAGSGFPEPKGGGFSGDEGPAVHARLFFPTGVAVDAQGNVYIADSGNHRIRRVSATGEEVSLSPVSFDLDLMPGDQGVRTKGGVNPSQKIDVEVVAVEKALGAVGFSARIEYNTLAMSYVSGSFKPGTMFSGTFAPLVNAKPGFVEVGGTTLGGGSATADKGTLGTLQFEAAKGFAGETYLTLTTAVYNRGGGKQDRFSPQTVITLNLTGALASDFDENGVVDFDDFFRFASAFGKRQGEAGFDAKYDLSRNGEVDFEDFFIFAAEFGKKI